MIIDMSDAVETVANGLYQVVDKVVVVGGAARQFYVQNSNEPIRPTVDVDCVVHAMTYIEFAKFEGELRKVGFSNSTDKGAPICRWLYKGQQVDIMPVNDKALGFSNRWYAEGFDNTIKVELPSCSIDIFTFPYYLASKFEAFLGRPDDFRTSSDIEDIVTCLDSRVDLDSDYKEMPMHLRAYLQEHLVGFLKINTFVESVSANLDDPAERKDRILNFYRRIATSGVHPE